MIDKDGLSPFAVNRILLATDFSRWTADAVSFSFEMARCFGAEILMIHGIEPIADAAVEAEEDDGDFDDFFGELKARSRQRLEDLVEEAEALGVSARYHIEIGERWRIIMDYADAEDVDLIVLGRRTYDEARQVPLGTTSQRIFFGSQRPVLTVPTAADESMDEQMEDQ